MFRWEDDPETQAIMGTGTPKSDVTATQVNYPSLPKPLHYDPSQSARAQSPLPPPQSGGKPSSKRSADQLEEDGEETDRDEVEGVASDSSKYSDALWETSDEDMVTAKALAAGSSRKERRTTTKDTPSKGKVSFASASTSFASTSASFVTAPATPGTGHRSRLAFDQDEDDIFTSRRLQKTPASSLFSKLVAAGVSPDSRTMFAPETPHRHSSRFTHLPSPNTPETSRRVLGPIGLQTPSTLTQEVFSFQNELGRISIDLESRLTELMGIQALQAEGFKRG